MATSYNINRLFILFTISITITIFLYSDNSKNLISNQAVGIKTYFAEYGKAQHAPNATSRKIEEADDDDDESFLDDSELIAEDGVDEDEDDDDDPDEESFDDIELKIVESLSEQDYDSPYKLEDIITTTMSASSSLKDDNDAAREEENEEDDDDGGDEEAKIEDEDIKNPNEEITKEETQNETDIKTKNDKIPFITYQSIRYNNDDYCVFPNIYKSEKRKNKISMILHTSSNYFGENLITMSKKWDGRISLAVFASSVLYSMNNTTESSVMNTIYKIYSIVECFEHLKESLSVHIVISWKKNLKCPSIQIDKSKMFNNNCDKAGQTLDKFSFNTFSLMYPVNTIRNVARKFQDSEYILFADMEQEYSANAEAILHYLADKWNLKNEKIGIAIRRFEYDTHIQAPVTMDELKKAIAKKLVYQFHVFFWPQGHKIAKLKDWLNETHTFDDVISKVEENGEHDTTKDEIYKQWTLEKIHTVDIKKLGTTYWEPMLVIHKSAKWHNEELPYGLDNHVALALHLCSAGYLFPVAPNVFSMHPGIRTQKENRKLAYKGIYHGNKALRRFYERMHEEYPDNSKKCLKNRLPKHLRQNKN